MRYAGLLAVATAAGLAALAAEWPPPAPLELVQTIALAGVGGRIDHRAVDVFEQTGADPYRPAAKIETAWMARTSLFAADLGRLYVAAPHMLPLQHEAKILVFAVRR